MSKTTKRKHVMKEILEDDYELPGENQNIVKICASKGNNLHEVEDAAGFRYLASMPTKFRKNIWVKRGDFVLVEPIAEGDKVKAEIVKIMTCDSIKHYKKCNIWPDQFMDKEQVQATSEDDIFVNTNRVNVLDNNQSDSESCSNESTSSEK